MFYIGQEIFELLNTIMIKSRDELQDDELFYHFCTLVEDEKKRILVMRFQDVLPNEMDKEVDWCEMSHMDFINFTINDIQKTIVFGNINNLLFGIKELYEHVYHEYPGLTQVAALLNLLKQTLAKIDCNLAIDSIADGIHSIML